MTLTDDRAKTTSTGGSDVGAQALFEEARRRRRRRRGVGAITVVVLAGALVTGLLLSTGSGLRRAPTRTAVVGGAGGRHSVRTVPLGGGIVPDQMVAASGRLWVLGSTDPGNQCEIEEIDPVTSRTRTFPLPACGTYISVGDGQILLADIVFTSATDSEAFHVETFDTTTHQAVVMAPVDITTTGTGDAHMAMAYGGGWLWLNPWTDRVLQISPTTGAVVADISESLSPGGGHPLVAAGATGLWLAPGVGGPAVIDRMAPLSQTPVAVFTGSPRGAVLWLSTVGRRVWAEVANDRNDGVGLAAPRLLAFDGSGRQVLDVPSGQLGESSLAVSGNDLWAVTAGTDCTGRQRLWRIDGRTGRPVVVATFATPAVPCPTEFSDTELAVAGGSAFVLDADSSVLFRIGQVGLSQRAR